MIVIKSRQKSKVLFLTKGNIKSSNRKKMNELTHKYVFPHKKKLLQEVKVEKRNGQQQY